MCVVAEGAACDKCAPITQRPAAVRSIHTYTHQPKGQIIRQFHQKISQIKTIDCLFVVMNCFDIIQCCLFVSLLYMYYIKSNNTSCIIALLLLCRVVMYNYKPRHFAAETLLFQPWKRALQLYYYFHLLSRTKEESVNHRSK